MTAIEPTNEVVSGLGGIGQAEPELLPLHLHHPQEHMRACNLIVHNQIYRPSEYCCITHLPVKEADFLSLLQVGRSCLTAGFIMSVLPANYYRVVN